MNRYEYIVYKALFLELFKMRRKAIRSILSRIHKLEDKREISSLYINVGMLYHKLHENTNASNYFIKGLTLIENDRLEYHPDFPKILQIIRENERIEVSNHWEENFKRRVRDDRRFSKCFKYNAERVRK